MWTSALRVAEGWGGYKKKVHSNPKTKGGSWRKVTGVRSVQTQRQTSGVERINVKEMRELEIGTSNSQDIQSLGRHEKTCRTRERICIANIEVYCLPEVQSRFGA